MTAVQKREADSLPALTDVQQHNLELIAAIVRAQYGHLPARLNQLLRDVTRLYAGEWETYEACEVTYHNLDHALDAALAVARMAAGWNLSPENQPLPESLFLDGIAAGLFHDAGYIKDKGDHAGSGGKYTITHVQRGMAMAEAYLRESGWPEASVKLVPQLISLTDYQREQDIDTLFTDPLERALARIVPTADLVAQMADVQYLPRLKDLFAEFKEMYEFEGPENLKAQGAPVYRSVKEIKDGVIDFYEAFVAPRLERYGRMDRYLTVFFGNGRNPYHENIAANLSSQLTGARGQWRRLGEVLKGLGLVNGEQIAQALRRQRRQQPQEELDSCLARGVRDCLLPWMDHHAAGNCLGDILMDMGALSPSALARGLLHQMAPPSLIRSLTKADLLSLVQISLLLHNICKGPWILGQVMEMANELLACEASSILLAKPGTEEMLISLPTGPRKKALQGKTIAVDKGLAGWVYRNGRPALVANVLTDERFDRAVDHHIDFETRSLVAVPLYLNGVCVGVIEAINKHGGRFTEHDLHLLTVLANMVSAALVNIIYQHISP